MPALVIYEQRVDGSFFFVVIGAIDATPLDRHPPGCGAAARSMLIAAARPCLAKRDGRDKPGHDESNTCSP
jgi:hypothetical protein